MKVLLINGSPKAAGCTYTALKAVADELEKNDIEAEIVHVGTSAVRGCMGCGMCAKNGDKECIYTDDNVNMIIKKMQEADGVVIGSPVHYAAASGALTSTLDRAFYAGGSMAHKLGASVVSCRRGGASAAFDQLNKYFTIAQMPIVSSNYWNQVHGNTPEEVLQDKEGIQTMQVLARNMAWMLKCIDAGNKAGVQKPEAVAKIKTNFIR